MVLYWRYNRVFTIYIGFVSIKVNRFKKRNMCLCFKKRVILNEKEREEIREFDVLYYIFLNIIEDFYYIYVYFIFIFFWMIKIFKLILNYLIIYLNMYVISKYMYIL